MGLLVSTIRLVGIATSLQTCRNLHEIVDSRFVWLQFVTRLTRATYLAPYSFPLAELSTLELRRIATRPYRFEYDVMHPAPTAPDPVSPDHIASNTPSLYLHPVGGAGPSDIAPLELSFGTPPRGILYASDVYTLPGGRWVVAAANAQESTTFLCCWDTNSPLQDGVLDPVATYHLTKPSGPNPAIVLQHSCLEQRVNILVRRAREYSRYVVLTTTLFTVAEYSRTSAQHE